MDVALENVRVDRDGRTVLDIPSLRLQGKRTTAILGPNGAGKTTLLRLIAGLERPRMGEIRLGNLPPRPGRDVAFVFQQGVFLRQSVRANLELGLRLRGCGTVETRTRVEEAMNLLAIAHLSDRRADRLSGGEGRRVNLARALCLRAAVVLLDEPLAGLDEPTYSRLLDEMPRLLGAFDATTLLVTHDPHEALRLAQFLVVIVGGRIHAAAEKRDVVTNPRVIPVAEALGYSVLLAGERHVAVPPGALRLGPGHPQFTIVVEDVLDVVDAREIVGRVDTSRVRLPCPATGDSPHPGERIVVHAERSFDVISHAPR